MSAANSIETQFMPVYNTCTWSAKGRRVHAPQCSQHDEFCYLCLFSPKDESEDGDDYYSTLVDIISDLVDEQKELPHIVKIVRHTYDSNIRPHIVYVDVENDIEIKSPSWSLDSIQRHIAHSSQWPSMPFRICESILTGAIVLQQKIINKSTGEIDEDKRKALMDTMKTLCFVATTNAKLNPRSAGKHRTRIGKSL